MKIDERPNKPDMVCAPAAPFSTESFCQLTRRAGLSAIRQGEPTGPVN